MISRHICKSRVLREIILFVVILLLAGSASATTFTVDDSGGADYKRIQDAINAASDGDTILVYSGTYSENVDVDKQLVLRGVDDGGGKPVVKGSRGTFCAIELEGWSTLEGFIVEYDYGILERINRKFHAGICVQSSNNNIIKDNVILNIDFGIYLYNSSYNILTNNTANSNKEHGISIQNSSSNILINNTANSNKWGGMSLSHSINNTLSGNTASNNNNYGISFYNSSYNTLRDNTAINNIGGGTYGDINNNADYGEGIDFYQSNYNGLSGNTASNNNRNGIRFYESSYNILINNNANSNNVGISLDVSSNNTLRNNTISNNKRYGIQLLISSTNNRVYHNNILNNQVDDENIVNFWDNGYPSGGNYWSDYKGIDANNDGIGDTPYRAKDNYPLMAPYKEPTPLLTPTQTPIFSQPAITAIASSVSIISHQDYMEQQFVSNGVFSSGPTDLIYRMTLDIRPTSGNFQVSKIVIYNTTTIDINRTYYQIDGKTKVRGTISVFPNRIEWQGLAETPASEFELGIHASNPSRLDIPFSSTRSVTKEILSGEDRINVYFSVTPSQNLRSLRVSTYAEDTDEIYSQLLNNTATNAAYIDKTSSNEVEWKFVNIFPGNTYIGSVQLRATPKSSGITRYWPYTRVQTGYGSGYTDKSSGFGATVVRYTDTVIGDVEIYFVNPVDYKISSNGKGNYYQRYRQYSEIVTNGEPPTIKIDDNFKPGIRTVSVGTTVTWINNDPISHTIVSNAGVWSSPPLEQYRQFSYTFNTPGTYEYSCNIHTSMKGTIIVTSTGGVIRSISPSISPSIIGTIITVLAIFLIFLAVVYSNRKKDEKLIIQRIDELIVSVKTKKLDNNELRDKLIEINKELSHKESYGTSYKGYFFAVAVVLGVLLLGIIVLAPGESNAPENSKDQKTITNSIGMEFVLIPQGEFDMGSPSNKKYPYGGPAFYMGKYEVTQKQWREVMGTNPSDFKGDSLPVENVEWNDVQEFIRKLNEKEGANKYRLPSMAEWEYAARAGTTTRYFFGDDGSKVGEYAWFDMGSGQYDANSDSKTHKVGQKKPNPWGLYDVYGNVYEWVSAPTDVVRGGLWGISGGSCVNGSAGCRKALVGFRLLMDAPASTNASETLKSTPLPTPKVRTTILQTPTVTPTKTTTATPVRLKVVEDVFNGDASAANKAGLERFENGYYYVVDWQGDKYIALKGKTTKLVKLILEQRNVENKVLAVGETWDIGGGWTVTAISIDAKASPGQVWLVLSKGGIKKDDKVVRQGEVYTYIEKSIGGESDVPLFVTYIARVYAGATSDMVQLSYTWTVDTTIIQTPNVTQTVSPISITAPAADQNIFTNSIGMEFVLIPAGEFDMGSPLNEASYRNEIPVHHVKISNAFYMGKYEVTQKQWREVMGNNPSNFKGDNLPLESVSWNDVQDFIKKLNENEGANKYRLPTEAEWEYAARAGTTTRYSFGDDESILGDYAWYDANSGRKTHDVGQKKPNPWGLYDMHGNVWEWMQDNWHSDYNGAPTDGSSWENWFGSNRVVRSGSWAWDPRSAVRYGFDQSEHSGISFGFRLVRDL